MVWVILVTSEFKENLKYQGPVRIGYDIDFFRRNGKSGKKIKQENINRQLKRIPPSYIIQNGKLRPDFVKVMMEKGYEKPTFEEINNLVTNYIENDGTLIKVISNSSNSNNYKRGRKCTGDHKHCSACGACHHNVIGCGTTH